jgi:hypothetical protein
MSGQTGCNGSIGKRFVMRNCPEEPLQKRPKSDVWRKKIRPWSDEAGQKPTRRPPSGSFDHIIRYMLNVRPSAGAAQTRSGEGLGMLEGDPADISGCTTRARGTG